MQIVEIERERPYLFALAYRLLGSVADAEDVLQEAFLRARTLGDVRSPRAMLTTIVTRLCLDEVRSARRRREDYVGPWLPEPIATDAPGADEQLASSESVSMAFLILLESLSPLERAVFVLREVLDLSFSDIAEVLGRSEAACRQLLHRARERVSERPRRYCVEQKALRSLTATFLGALAAGDVDTLTRMLTDDVSVVADHGGKASSIQCELTGTYRVSRYLTGLFRKMARIDWKGLVVWLNGSPGFIAIDPQERIFSATVFDVVEHEGQPQVAAFWVIRNPDKLIGLNTALASGQIHTIPLDPLV